MKKLILALLVVVMLGGLLLVGCSSSTTPASSTTGTSTPSSSTQVKTVSLRWAHFAAPQLESSQPLIQMAEDIGTRTNGRYTCNIFWGDSLVPMFESMDAVRTGSAEMATFPFGPFSSADIRFASSEMPFFYNTIEAQMQAQGALMPSYANVFKEKFNQTSLMVSSIIPLNVGCTKRPIKTIDDWKGLVVMSISPVTSKVVTAFGATGAPSSPIDVYELLEKGTVDATIQSLGKFYEAKLWEVCPYLTNSGLCPASATLTINLDVWNKMPKDVQDIMVDESNKAVAQINVITQNTYYSYLDTLTQNMEVYNLPKAERDKWKALAAPIDDDLIAQMGDFGQEVQRTADEANAKYPYPY